MWNHCVLKYLLLLTLLSLGSAYITWIIPNLPLAGEPAPPGAPWPMPQSWVNSTTLYTLDPTQFEITTNVQGCDIIDTNIETYQKYIFIDSQGKADDTKTKLLGLQLTITDPVCNEYPQYGMDESYEITIDETSAYAQLISNTVWGSLRGLETFSELVWEGDDRSYYINKTYISDFPRFSHRGLMLDSARHYLPLSIIMDNLKAMQINKLNILHWHLSDDQSFPYVSQTYPNVSELGAYIPSLVYTNEDVNNVIEAARLRGIRVVPEFDSPGHTRAIGNSFKTLITACYGDGKNPYTPDYPNYSDMEIFDPSNEDVYTFMQNLISEAHSVFKDEAIHLGMDEVTHDCWASNPYVNQFMADNNIDSYVELEGYYDTRIAQIVGDLGYKYTAFQDPIENGINMPMQTLVHVWKDTSLDSSFSPWQYYMQMVAEKGYDIIFSSCWYLNYISYGPDWKTYYQCDPQDFGGTADQQSQVKGGEACIWGEYVDGTNIMPRLWPRASAVAERLWSDASVNDVDSANFRLDQQRCRMVQRGIPAEPILDGYCGDYDWGMPPQGRK